MADLNLESALLNKDCLILDGGLGTYLEEVGETLQAELWSAGHLISNSLLLENII
jgi:S-methylmethionine-dependent homocysteine/selenocysteine methylase